MPVYTFTFPEHRYAGTFCTITDDAGATVHTATLGGSPDGHGAAVLQVNLPEGVYVGTAFRPGFGTLVTQGILDVVDSITASGVGGGSLDPAADQTITGAWVFDPPLVGTLDEFGNSDVPETIPLTLKSKGLGTAALNVISWDDDPLDPNGYGISHLDSDGGGGFAGGRITWSENGHVDIDGEVGTHGLRVESGSWPLLIVGDPYAAVTVGNNVTTAPCLAIFPATDQTADGIEMWDPTGSEVTFRVTTDAEVHAPGGVVLKSPNGTAYRLVVANDGSLTTEAV